MAKKKKGKSKGASITAEFGHKDAKGSGGGGIRIPEGDYLAKIIKAEPKEAKTGSQMIVWTFKIIEGKYKGKKSRTTASSYRRRCSVFVTCSKPSGSRYPRRPSRSTTCSTSVRRSDSPSWTARSTKQNPFRGRRLHSCRYRQRR